jgi:hypothetical protein
MIAKLEAYIQKLEASKMISVKHENRGERVYLKFPKQPPRKSGVYVIYDCAKGGKKKPKPFNVGQGRNLLRRITFLFRCNSINNPHPCQTRFAKSSGKKISEITHDEFCQRFQVRFVSVSKYADRLKIEKMLQNKYGTNRRNPR